MPTDHPPLGRTAANAANRDARVLGAVIDAHAAGTSTGSPAIALALGLPRPTVVDALDRLLADGLITRDPGVAGSTRPAVTVVARSPW